jgi:hypothetical protein
MGLSVDPVTGEVICSGGSFSPLSFTAQHATKTLTGDISYKVEFVSWTNILDLTGNKGTFTAAYDASTPATWTPTTATDAYGAGVYRVTP